MKTAFGFVQVMLKELRDHFLFDDDISIDEVVEVMLYADRTSEVVDIVRRFVESILCISDRFDVEAKKRISVKAVKSLSPQVLFKLSTIKFSPDIKELPEDIFDNMPNVRFIDFSNTSIKSFPSSMLCLSNLRFLNLRFCKVLDLLQLCSITYFKKIELLDLSGTLFKEFPGNIFEGLDSLRLLDLSKCSQLLSLPSSIFCLINLEHLYLRSCKNLSVLPSSIQGWEKLQVLEMTETKLIEIPEQFFKNMNSLKQLDLSSNLHLTSIHTSLHDVDHIVTSSFPNLQILNLSYVPVRQLSLKNCPSLETIALLSNKNLEKLDLSSTNLKKFPIQGDDQDFDSLKQLELLNTKHLITIDWKDIKWLPQEVNWAQCGDGTTSHMYIRPFQQSRDGVFISVGDADIFHTLTPSSKLWKKSLSQFVVYVCPCEERGRGKTLTPRRATLRYDDIFSKIKRSIPSYERCLEIERVNKLPKGISGILSHAQFFILHDEKIIMRLSDLGIKNMGALRECLLERCHAMQAVFSVGAKVQNQPMLMCLEKIQISNLMKLTHMCESGRKLEHRSFGRLKHIQIEHCPQLVNVFSTSVCLKSLEVLEIKFCPRLEEIFSGKENEEGSLPQLKTLCLLELPALKNIIHNVWLVSLEKAQIKGCPRLRELPLRSDRNIQNNNQKVPRIVVKCELECWEQLEWKDKNVKQQVSFIDWQPFQTPKQG
ncbi:Nb-arc domain-containing disease resistance protein [Thalictrum thalictroides]|uniref:Nb-arc domain-containing disease resistance protein n=1 Tax=Thalictrum thalictroides TaxID=46969 RepID=A0A7J6VKR0_THATH|nr:Nb-arc domain-containing disease resistance protein [Thalictrum thalictroides]